MSLKSFLTRLIWLCVLPPVLLCAYLAVDRVRELQSQRDQEGANLTRNFATTLDRLMTARISALQVLAASSALAAPDRLGEFYQEARAFGRNFGTHVVLADLHNRMLFNTRTPFGTELPNLPPIKGRSAASIAAATGSPAVSDLFLGPVSRTPLVSVAIPVYRNGRMTHLLLNIIDASQIQQRLNDFALPPGYAMAIVDGQGEVVAHRSPTGAVLRLTGQGIPGRFTVSSAASAWSVLLQVPPQSYLSPVLTATAALALAVFGAILVSVLGGVLAGRRLARSVASLTEPGQSRTASPAITEIDAVRAILTDAAAARARAETTLREGEERLRLALDASNDGLWDWDLKSGTVYRSPRYFQLIGRLPGEGGPDFDYFLSTVHPDDRQQVLSAIEAHKQWHTPFIDFEYRLSGAGETKWMRGRGKAVTRDADGVPLRMVGTLSDITGRKLTEAALCESEERQRLFIEYAPAALAMFDLQMRYLHASRRWLSDYGLEGCDLTGRSHYEVFPEVPENWREIHRRGLAGEVLRAEADRFERADGSVRWLCREIRPWHDAAGEVAGIIIFSEDISERIRAEEEIRQLNADLERRVERRTAELKEANRELDAFAYAVSHDLRAPLRAVNGFSQALAEDCAEKLDDKGLDYLDQITLGCRQMGELIDALLTLSRTGRSELCRVTVDLSRIAAEIADELTRQEPERSVNWRIEPGMSAEADPRLLGLVLRNLIGNAWKYTARTPGPQIRVHCGQVDGVPTFQVTDNGAGFDMKHARKLFTPFQRLHRQDEFPGIGIGLATVMRIVKRHGGDISAEAQPGKGATFRFTLQAAAGG